MNRSSFSLGQWARIGVISGLLVCAIYPLLIVMSLPLRLQVILAGALGPLLITASLALYQVLAAVARTVSVTIALVFNVLAGAAISTMLIVQLAINARWEILKTNTTGTADLAAVDLAGRMVWSVNLGQDVVWDVFIGLGTFFFAWNMRGHPRFGRIISWSGMLIASALLALNFVTFPVPPANAGLLDLGPVLGLWYLGVTVAMARALKWCDAHEIESKGF